ncbi:Phosphodiesterase/alkaline phosphatase D [Duganella sp. CF402]|uniref:alkaline phosphatase D family protein n=1 Tax=unclassified Duganella TaxID=2636909 RepID=UPI0008CDFD6B|nr:MULTISPECIES: alkaline phosphatase D family protein [unclassified Duganella]RZT08740.1 alkaline phosphatase D [Duganella sp. BK701]SEL83551.1 Phosphodiesterase/alkaline phosphatase D [Duganella sp. CF402]
MDRRQFLKFGSFITVSVASGAGLSACGGSGGAGSELPAASGAWKFPQSVASGDPRADSILLWTRAVPASADNVAVVAGGADASIRLVVTSADNSKALGSNAALSGTTVADVSLPLQALYDNTVRHKLTGLSAATTYYYQFIAGDNRSNVGRFKTAPAADADVSQLQFVYMTCQDWSVNHWGAMSAIAAENLDFIVHLGDYIYETVGEDFQLGAVESRHDALVLPDGVYKNGTSGAKYASTLADYRYLYKKYRTDTRLQALHERFAFIAIWDDHEFSDDAWQDAQTYDGSFNVDGSDLHQTPRRRNANQAWFEFMAADVALDSAATGFQNIKIYRDFQFGKLMQLVMTDERLYRADHIIPESSVNPATGKPLGRIGSRYLVPQDLFDSVEAQKMAGAKTIGLDPLTTATILGNTQRQWWMDKMKSATATWKLWGNEVSLLRMGLNGTDAVATLLALSAVPTLATSVASTASAAGGNFAVAGAIVAAVTAGASGTVAQAGAGAIAATAAGGAADAQAAAGVKAGLTAAQASIAVATYGKTIIAGSGIVPATPAQLAAAAAQTIAFGYIKPEVQANEANSAFVAASGKKEALAAFFTRFLLNCDQWDGYNTERKTLMAHLKTNNIGNVVALTGDIHSFFAGTVNDDFDAAGGGTPVMVDLVSAGISSDSFFSYLRDAASTLGDIGTLVSYPLAVPVTGLGTINLSFNLLDYTMGKTAPTLASLLEQTRVQLRSGLAAKGVPEAQLEATVTAVLAGLQANSDFNISLLALAQQLSALGNNPWLKHLNTDAQGYTLVTLTAGKLTAQFKQVNKLVGTAAPATVIARTTTATVTAGSPAVTIS